MALPNRMPLAGSPVCLDVPATILRAKIDAMAPARRPDAYGEPARAPVELPPNRIPRLYRGGQLMDAFRGELDAVDSGEPEDWVGSTTRSWMPRGAPPTNLGLATLPSWAGGGFLVDAVGAWRAAWLGSALDGVLPPGSSGLLVKLLDAAVRLPVHLHPDRRFARTTLGSPFGKTEAWIVLGTRRLPREPPPAVHLGLRDELSPDTLRAAIDTGGTSLLAHLHRREVRAGDAWLVPAGLPHAIGAGVFLLELQEPTDFSIMLETAGFGVSPSDAHLGVGWDAMLPAVDLRPRTDAAIDALAQPPRVELDESAGGQPPDGPLRVTSLMGRAAAPFFRAEGLNATARANWPFPGTFAVGVTTAGTGRLVAPDGALDLRRGVTFALPAVAADDATIETEGGLELICCRPPDAAALEVDLRVAAD